MKTINDKNTTIMCTITKETIRRANARIASGSVTRLEGGISDGYISVVLHGKRFSQPFTDVLIREAYGKALRKSGES